MRRRAWLLALLALAACRKRTPPRDAGAPEVAPAFLIEATHATRLLASPSGAIVLAEIAYAGDSIPPILQVIDARTRTIVVTRNGWALGAPTDDGELLYLEEHQRDRYQVRSTTRADLRGPITPPREGSFPAATVRAGDGVAVVAMIGPGADPEPLWLASIDPATLQVVATTQRSAAAMETDGWKPRFVHQVLASTTRSELYLVGRDAIDSLSLPDLLPRWTAAVSGQVSLGGDGTHLFVDGDGIDILSTATGAVEQHLDALPGLEPNWLVDQIVPVPGADAVAIGLVVRLPVGFDGHERRPRSIDRLELTSLTRTALFTATPDLAWYQIPRFVIAGPKHSLWIAPGDNYWVDEHVPGGWHGRDPRTLAEHPDWDP